MDIKLIAQAIASANANRAAYRGKVFNTQGDHVGWVHYMHGICKSLSGAV